MSDVVSVQKGKQVADCCGGYITQRHELLGGRSETAFQKK